MRTIAVNPIQSFRMLNAYLERGSPLLSSISSQHDMCVGVVEQDVAQNVVEGRVQFEQRLRAHVHRPMVFQPQ